MKTYIIHKVPLFTLVFTLAICSLHRSLMAQTINVCSGLKDVYVCPEEPVTPDGALLSFFSNQYSASPCFGLLEFDNFPGLTKCNGTAIPQNALFIHQLSFPVTAGSIGAATLQFRAKAAPVGQTNSDFITFFEGSTYITGASLNQLVEAGGTWNPNQDATFVLDLNNLPPAFSIHSILHSLYDGDLDIVIGNETGVDWMCLDAVSDTCYCAQPSFSNLYLRGPGGPSIPIQCETSYENIGCPDPGKGFTLTGLFECAGDSCDTQPYVYWDLIGPSGGSVASGSAPGPYFGVNLWPAYFAQPGIYTMKLNGFCNFDTCTCEFQFIVDCPLQCPCDINDLQADVNQGFNHVLFPRQCQACFTPKALNECDSVYWYITDPNSTAIGSSVGNNSFCYTFQVSGTYTVFMEVTRKKPDGSNCETFRMSQVINIKCGINPVCDNSVYSNPSFSEGAVSGGLNSGGSSSGWLGIWGDPQVMEGTLDSYDGWTMKLWGNLDTASVLTTVDAICLQKDTGVFILRFHCWKTDPGTVPYIKIRMHIQQDGTGFEFNNCNGIDCYEIADISVSNLNPNEWYDIQIPYDLRQWMPLDSCGNGAGVMVRPIIYVTNGLSSEQGGQNTVSNIVLDNFCVDGTIIGVPSTKYLAVSPRCTATLIPPVIRWRIGKLVIDSGGRDSTLLKPYHLQTAVLKPASWPDPNVSLSDSLGNPVLTTFNEEVILDESSSVASKIQAISPAPQGYEWYGLQSNTLTASVSPNKDSTSFEISFEWYDRPEGSQDSTGACWMSDDKDDLYQELIVDAFTFLDTAELITSQNEIGIQELIRIFPNPTKGTLNIQLPFPAQSEMSFQVLSLTGQRLLEKKADTGMDVQAMDVSLLPQGMYFLKVLSKGQVIAVNKFVKQ